jgi:hypothetical protein
MVMSRAEYMTKLGEYFQIRSNNKAVPAEVSYDEATKKYTVKHADVLMWDLSEKISELPVQFDRVEGQFYAINAGLKTLKGAPSWVSGDFKVSRNQLTTLEHAPDHVGGDLELHINPLINLNGFPTHVGADCHVSYHEDLPLLRLLVVQGDLNLFRSPLKIKEIMTDPKWARKGKSHILLCSNELKQAGFAGNARW